MKSGSVGKRYIPKRGDIVWVVLDPVAGREQAGRRPVIVLSDTSYNQRSGIAICCPITSQIKHYPFEVLLPEGLPLSGVVLTDQIKALDIASRIPKI
jgi:mRNA interferase MazF